MPYCIYHMRRVAFSNVNILANLTSFCLEILQNRLREGRMMFLPYCATHWPWLTFLWPWCWQSKASMNVARHGAD